MRNRLGIMISMNRLSTEKRAQIIGSLVEGEQHSRHGADDRRL